GLCSFLGLCSFPGSAWERIGVEAPASRVHKLWMHFGEAEPRLQSVPQVECPTELPAGGTSDTASD
ncbi:MAG: hypothetical protein WCK15_24200, partial [Pirellula sp.]